MSDVLDKRKNTAALLHVGLFAAAIILNIIIAYLKINIASVFLSAAAIAFIAAFYLMSYKYYFLLSLFAISEAFSLLLFRNAESVLITAMIFFLSCAIVYLFRKKYNRVRILVITSVLLLIFAFIYYLTYIFLHGGIKSFGEIPGKLRADIDSVIDNVKNIYLEYIGYEPSGDPIQTETDMLNVKKSLSLFVPGFIILSANAVSFLITAVMRLFFNLFYKVTSYKRFFIDKIAWRIHLSLISLLLIPLTIILNSFSGADSNIIYLCIVDSVNFFLTPAIFVIGMYFIKDYVVNNFYHSATKIITLAVIAVMVSFIFPTVLYFIFVVAGMIKESKYYLNIIEEKIKKTIGKEDDDDDLY